MIAVNPEALICSNHGHAPCNFFCSSKSCFMAVTFIGVNMAAAKFRRV